MKNILKGLEFRVINNYRTTIVGLILLLIGVVGLIIDKISFTDFTSFISIIITLFYVQDSFFYINPRRRKRRGRDKDEYNETDDDDTEKNNELYEDYMNLP
jgi:hypothetical protein